MARLPKYIPLLLFTLVLIYNAIGPMGTWLVNMEQFKDWYPEWGSIFANIMKNKCQEEYQLFLKGSTSGTKWVDISFGIGAGGFSTAMAPLVNCIVENSSEYQKSGMAAANVVLGLTPAILAAMGTTVDETSLLFIFGRRPLLALCLSAGSPGVPPRPLFDYRKFEQLQEKRPGRLKLAVFPLYWEALIWIGEHLVVLASIANVLTLGYELGRRAVMVFAPEATYLPVLWLSLGSVAHALAAFTLWLRVEINGPAIKGLGAWLKYWVAPRKADGQTQFKVLPETPLDTGLSGLNSLFIASHIILGTLAFSSMLFISVRDCIPVVGRLIASVIACRLVLMYELARLRDLCQGRDGKGPVYTIKILENSQAGSAEESGDPIELGLMAG